MRISFSCKTNKDYVMVNTLKVQLNSGSVLTLDRHNTEYSISDPDNAGECLLDMEWRNCYLWAIDEENLWYDDKALIEEDCEKLFEGARLIELELEDDADEDYYVSIEALSIDGVSISIPDKLKSEDFPSYETFTNIFSQEISTTHIAAIMRMPVTTLPLSENRNVDILEQKTLHSIIQIAATTVNS